MSSQKVFVQAYYPEKLRVHSLTRPLLGMSPAVLVLCNDGHYYVIHDPVSAMEDKDVVASLLGPAIAAAIGLPTAFTSSIVVDDSFAEKQVASGTDCFGLTQTGSYCAERLTGSISGSGRAIPYVSPRRQSYILNRSDLTGMCLLGVWSGRGMPRAMFSTLNACGDLKAFLVGASQLFANDYLSLAPLTVDLSLMNNSLYRDLWTPEVVRSWLMIMQERIPPALKHTFATVAKRWPSVETLQMHTILLERLKDMNEALQLRDC